MTREQQRKVRELNKYLPQILKNNVKVYGFKKKDYMVWSSKKEMYFSLLITIREREGHCYCASLETIKPLWMDDLFWDVMDMPENKSEPLSLRCVGAFAIYGMPFSESEQELPEWSTEELEKCVTAYLEHFHQTVNSCDLESYGSVFDVTAYQGDVQKILGLIHRQEYQKALECVRSMEDGESFQNKGIWFRDYVEQYCKRYIVG